MGPAAGSEQLARAVVADVLGKPTATADVLTADADAAVVRLTLDGDRPVVVKLRTVRARPQIDLRRTAAAMAQAGSTGLPVAAVFGAGESGNWQYLIMEHLEGAPWRELRHRLTDSDLDSADAELASVLTALQTLRLDSFGELDVEAAPPGHDLLTALHRRADLRVPDPLDRLRIHNLFDREARLLEEAGPPTLSHDDLHHGNVLFRRDEDRWRVAGILDWDKCWAGPAESDLARMAFWDDMTGPRFWSAYRASVPETDGYVERARIFQLLWCLEYPSTSARHRADRAALARRLRL